MPPQGVLLQPLAMGLVEVANDDDCDATIIESDDDTDGTEIESDNQSGEDEGQWDEEHGDGNTEQVRRGGFHAIEQPKMLQEQLTEFELKNLSLVMDDYEQGAKAALTDLKTFGQPLYCISIMAYLAEKLGIWGPFVIVARDSMLHRWQQEITKFAPSLKVLPYWGTAADRKILRKAWDQKYKIHTEGSPFHVLVTSYQHVLSDANSFQKLQWQFTVLDGTTPILNSTVSDFQNLLGFRLPDRFKCESTGSEEDQPNINQNAEHPSDTGVVGKRKAHSSKRSHERVDGLEHLLPALPAVGGNETDEMHPLHGIAFCLIRLNITILEARDQAHQNYDYNLFSSLESSHMNGLITADECKEGYPTPGIPMDSAQETRLAEYINTYSGEQIIQRIRDPKALPYMSKLFEHRLLWWESWKGQKRMVERDPDFVVPTRYKEKGKSGYAMTCVMQHRLWRQKLRDLYHITLQLQRHAVSAASSDLLDDVSLRQLKAKMTALQQGFQEACEELGYPRKQLVWDTQPWWLDPQDAELNHKFLDHRPKNIVTAFPPLSNKNTNSALTFLVPVLSLLSCIPTALAWAHSPHQTGTASDADFFQLISNTAMQLLGNLTLIIPTISNARLVGQAWFWTWVLAGTSTICAIVAIPLYLNAPTEWSAAVAFAGNVMQAFVTLQLMFAI